MSSKTVSLTPRFHVRSWLGAVWSLLRGRPTAYKMAFVDVTIADEGEMCTFARCAFYGVNNAPLTVIEPDEDLLAKAARMRELQGKYDL